MSKLKKKAKDYFSSINYVEEGGKVVLGIGGGVAGNKLTSWLEQQSWMGPAAPYAPAVTGLVGTLGSVFIKNPYAKSLFFGMAVVGGTEEVEGMIGKVSGALGFTQQQLGLGFTGKPQPSQDRPFYSSNGMAVR